MGEAHPQREYTGAGEGAKRRCLPTGWDAGDFISWLRKVRELKLVSYFRTFPWRVFRLRLISY